MYVETHFLDGLSMMSESNTENPAIDWLARPKVISCSKCYITNNHNLYKSGKYNVIRNKCDKTTQY